VADDILSRSVPLVFKRSGAKWFAETPAGELAYGDSQGLYEWRRVHLPGGGMTCVRIDYSGGDQQAARNGQMLTRGTSGSIQAPNWPAVLGRRAAIESALFPDRLS
jgi:hypothetical protein